MDLNQDWSMYDRIILSEELDGPQGDALRAKITTQYDHAGDDEPNVFIENEKDLYPWAQLLQKANVEYAKVIFWSTHHNPSASVGGSHGYYLELWNGHVQLYEIRPICLGRLL